MTRSNVSSSQGSVLHLADAQIGVRQTRAGELEQRLGGVDPVRLAAALGDQAQEGADAAADVEHAPARLEPDAPQRRLVGGDLLVLAERPVGGAGAPERPPTARAAGDGG